MQRRHFIASLGALAASAAGIAPAFAQHAANADSTTARNLAQRLAAYAASLSYDDLDDATVELAKTHLSDALGCGVAAFGEKPVQHRPQVALAKAAAKRQAALTVLGTS